MEGAGFTNSDESVHGGPRVPLFFYSLTRRRSIHHYGPQNLLSFISKKPKILGRNQEIHALSFHTFPFSAVY